MASEEKSRKRPRTSATATSRSIRRVEAFPADTPADTLLAYYRTHQILLVREYARHAMGKELGERLSEEVVRACRRLYAEAPEVVDKTFTLETSSTTSTLPHSHSPAPSSSSCIFGSSETKAEAGTTCPPGTYYSSFIAQGNKSEAVSTFKGALPLLELPFAEEAMRCTKPIWMFVGRNDGESDLPGRKEHVDAVTHDGTWHMQSSGSKVWYVRPADVPEEWGVEAGGTLQIEGSGDLLHRENTEVSDDVPRLRVECRMGDLLVINTRMWWHQTRIPPTVQGDHLSVSYARDFFAPVLRLQMIDNRKSEDKDTGSNKDLEEEDEGEEEEEYTNLEGLYASKDVKAGDIVLVEEEMPDCSVRVVLYFTLHSSCCHDL